MRKKYSSKFKAKVALEALKNEKTLAQLSNEFEVHRVQIGNWKKSLEEALPDVFSVANKKANREKELKELTEELYKQIGQLKVENDFLKKKSDVYG